MVTQAQGPLFLERKAGVLVGFNLGRPVTAGSGGGAEMGRSAASASACVPPPTFASSLSFANGFFHFPISSLVPGEFPERSKIKKFKAQNLR